MGTAALQGQLWGARAQDWASLQEPTWNSVYRALFTRAGVKPGTKLLDIGRGGGGALLVARALGADVAGLDASEALVAVARERLPGVRIECGEMEELSFADRSFDVATGFNSFQFAGDPVRALSEARRVLNAEGILAMLVWGRAVDCELLSTVMPPIFALLPPAPPGAPGMLAFAEPGVIEGLMERAGFASYPSGEIDSELHYSDTATAERAIFSAAPFVRAVKTAGEDTVRDRLRAALSPFRRADGSVALKNRFRYVLAKN